MHLPKPLLQIKDLLIPLMAAVALAWAGCDDTGQ